MYVRKQPFKNQPATWVSGKRKMLSTEESLGQDLTQYFWSDQSFVKLYDFNVETAPHQIANLSLFVTII